jgi:hypothetical protein
LTVLATLSSAVSEALQQLASRRKEFVLAGIVEALINQKKGKGI